ncbi:MAG: class I SAM-dependent methyltransferase [Thermodesulfobacteriota bacterium]
MATDERSDAFLAQQRAHFAAADVEHFLWQTRGAGFAEREAAFVRGALAGAALPLLEIGCGEGANLLHLAAGRGATDGGPARFLGVDAFAAKVAFAARAVPAARFACADAGRLPFADGSFATVLVRDLLHHLPQPRAALEEGCRVLRPRGRFVLVEPNARNPLIRLQMALVPAERGAARSDERWLRALLTGLPLVGVEAEDAAPLPLDRVLLHHRFGLPSLGSRAGVVRALGALERAAARLLPRSRWSYVVIRATRA